MSGWLVRIRYREHDATTVTLEREFAQRPSVQLTPPTDDEPWPRAIADDGEQCWIVYRPTWIERIPPAADPP